jgi:hypothetical protein
MSWINEGRPGYLGKHRTEKFHEWDLLYGKGDWRLAWLWGRSFVTFTGACHLYEDAYVAYLGKNRSILNELIRVACDVYDDSPSNITSGVDYLKQETERTHIQDIAIRRALKRLNTCFHGTQLLQIRQEKGIHSLSMTLSPGKVPFNKMDKITRPWLKGWWDQGTVECFYQSNRILQVRR